MTVAKFKRDTIPYILWDFLLEVSATGLWGKRTQQMFILLQEFLFHLCCHWFPLNSPDTKLDPMQKLRIYANQVGMGNDLKISSTQWDSWGAVFIPRCLNSPNLSGRLIAEFCSAWGEGKASVPPLRQLDTASHPPLHRNKHTDMSSARRWGQNQTSLQNTKRFQLNQPASCAKSFGESRDDLRIKKIQIPGQCCGVTKWKPCRGHGKHFRAVHTSSHRENSAGFSLCCPVSHTPWGACYLQPRTRRGWELLVLLVMLTKAGAGQESQCLGKVWMQWRYVSANRVICEYK